MSDLAEYERRISYALERINRGMQLLAARPTPTSAPAPAADPAMLADLRDALEAERTANAQLSERVRAIREKQETTLSALERRLAAATHGQDQAAQEIARLKRANAELVAANRALSTSGGAPDPHLINRAMQAELESLRAARAADLVEITDIMTALEPLVVAATPVAQAVEG